MTGAISEALVDQAIRVLQRGFAENAETSQLYAALDALPAPVYVTDPDGWVTYFNPACIDFAGRIPVPGHDRWCVTWKLYPEEGTFLPHSECPMAVALIERREVRDLKAIAERPDGTRVVFLPYPTPLFGRDGSLRGAVNVFIDLTDERQATLLRTQASRCRRLSDGVSDTVAATLIRLALDYEAKADALDSRGTEYLAGKP